MRGVLENAVDTSGWMMTGEEERSPRGGWGCVFLRGVHSRRM